MHLPPIGSSNLASSPSPSSHSSGTLPLGGQRMLSRSVSVETENVPDYDPNIPLQSVEQEVSPMSSGESTPSSPSVAMQDDIIRQTASQGAVQEQVEALLNLKLTSPNTSEMSSQRVTPTPSIIVSSSAPPTNDAMESDRLVAGFEVLHVEPHGETSVAGTLEFRESCSPSPSRRRRSGSGIIREIHRVEDEAPPRARFHLPEVQKALSDVRSKVARMTDVLSSSDLHLESESNIQTLHQQALNLNRLQLPSSRIVGLVGDSGVGKSSLINSLLDKVDLARASSSGTACTCAVTEYKFHDKDDFAIHIEYFTLDELKKQFQELLRAYRDYQLLPKHAEGNCEDKEKDGINKALTKKAEVATQTFRAIFKEKLEDNPRVLTLMGFDSAIDLMVEWVSRILPRFADQASFDTIEQCSSRIRELTSEMDDFPNIGRVQTPWPFIRKLCVYLNAYILSKGLIIADLPGLRDQNSARKAITEGFIRQCHQIFAVARIDRAITDESVIEIFELARRANLSKIDVVCTRSEEIQTREAKHDWVAEQARIEELQAAINNDTQELENLQEEIDDFEKDLAYLTREEEQEFKKLQHDQRKAEKSKKNNEFELVRLIVELRNAKVSDGLLKQYQDHPIAATLRTFCVSNKIYWDYRNKPTTASMPYLNMCGIIGLRQYCIGIVADSRFRAATDFIKDQVPAFLGSIELWVEAGSGSANAERKQQILDTVSAVQHALNEITSPESQTNKISCGLRKDFNDHIDERMQQRGMQWAVSAREASMVWQGWHHSSYKAFCSNYGNHTTSAKGYHCWNEEAMTHMKSDMTDAWSHLTMNQDRRLLRVLEAMTDAFDNVLQIITSGNVTGAHGAKTPTSVVRTLMNILYHRRDLTICGTEDAIEELRYEFFALETNALAPIRTAFIGKNMESTYHAANMEFGSGSDQRRKTLINGRFGSKHLFNDHRNACKKAYGDLARAFQRKLNNVMSQQVQLIEADLQIIKDENAVLESERNPDFRERVKAELEFVKKDLDRIRCTVEDFH